MSNLKVLVVGGTGHISRKFLAQMLNSANDAMKDASYSMLLCQESCRQYFTDLNIPMIVPVDTKDLAELRNIAKGYDMIVDFAYELLPPRAKALVAGLGDRRIEAETNSSRPVFIQATHPPARKNINSQEHTRLLGDDSRSLTSDMDAGVTRTQETSTLEDFDGISLQELGIRLGVKMQTIENESIQRDFELPNPKQALNSAKNVLRRKYMAITGHS